MIPYFPELRETGSSPSASVAENTPKDMNIGGDAPDAPVAATDTDGDTLTYGLSGTDAASFDIDTATGQLKTKEGVTYNHEVKDTYSVKVTVSDGKDAAGDPDTAVDDTITVTITVMDVNEGPDVHQC